MNYFAANNINKMYVRFSGNEISPKLYLEMGILASEQDTLMSKSIKPLSTEHQCFLTGHFVISTSSQDKIHIAGKEILIWSHPLNITNLQRSFLTESSGTLAENPDSKTPLQKILILLI